MRARKSGLRATPIRTPTTTPPVAAVPPRSSAAANPGQPAVAGTPVIDEPPAEAFDPVQEPIEALRSGGLGQMGGVIGGVIAGIEQQVFGRRPPGEVEIRQVQPARGLTDDGTTVTLEFPDTEHP